MYTWLYRNDRDWLNKNSPYFNRRNNNKRVDWNNRDDKIAEEIIQTVIDILKQDKPKRINISSIGKAIDKLTLLEKHIDKLPKTNFILNEVTETVEEFQKRRIVWAIEQLKLQGESLEKWKILRLAGIKNDASPSILLTLEKVRKNT